MEDFYKGKNVLVTGGAGFIGSYIAEKLSALGAKVRILDNLSTGRMENLENIIESIEFIKGDIADLETCVSAARDQEIIFHLAALVSVPESMDNPGKCNSINVQGTWNVLEAARRSNVKRFVFSSSSAVYGSREGMCSEDSLTSPESVYGFSKLMGEEYCKMYSSLFGLGTICLRYFNVFGDRQAKDGAYAAVVAKFSDCMKNGQSVSIYGDGRQTRDFISVLSVAEANLKLGSLDLKHLNGQSVNIASGKSISLLELFEDLKKKFRGYDKEIIFKPERPGDIRHSSADCRKYLELEKFL